MNKKVTLELSIDDCNMLMQALALHAAAMTEIGKRDWRPSELAMALADVSMLQTRIVAAGGPELAFYKHTSSSSSSSSSLPCPTCEDGECTIHVRARSSSPAPTPAQVDNARSRSSSAAASSIVCPKCFAPAGEYCRNPATTRAVATHPARHAAAARQVSK